MEQSAANVNEIIEPVSDDLFVRLLGPAPDVLVLRVDDDEDAELRVTSVQEALAFAGDRPAQFFLTTSDGAYTGLAAILKGEPSFAPPTVTLLRERDGKRVGVWMLGTPVPASNKADVARLEDVAKGLDNQYASDPCPLPGTDGWVVADMDEGRLYAVDDIWRAAVVVHGEVDGSLQTKSVRLSVGSHAEAENWMPWDTNVVGLLQRLTRHEPGTKDGDAILQGRALPGDKKRGKKLVSPDGARTARAMEELCLLGLDLDSGEDIDVLRRNIQDAGLFALIWSTHSHMKGVTRIKRDAIMKHAARETGDPTLDECLNYLRGVKRYQDTVLDGATLEAEMERDHAGFWMVVHHNPMPKYRIVFVLKEPFDPAKQGATHNAGLALWAAKYEAVATKLGAVFDRSCVDVSRLFYTARHTPGERWGVEVIAGKPLDIDGVVALPRGGKGYAKTGDAYADAADEMGATGSGGDRLGKKFMALYGKRFEVDRFLLQTDPDGDRGQRSSGMGRTHCCPNDDQHTRAGDTEDQGFFCTDASEAESGQAVASCRHDSCAGLDRIDFVKLILDREGMTWGDLGEWVPEVEGEDDFDPALFGKGAVSGVEKFADVNEAESAIAAIVSAKEGGSIASRIGASRFAPVEQDFLKKLLIKKTGVGAKAINDEMKAGKAKAAASGDDDEVTSDDDVSAELAKLNEKYAAVLMGGKFRIIQEPDKAGRAPIFLQQGDFTAWLENQRVVIMGADGNTKRVPITQEWNRWKERRSYKRLVFQPGRDTPGEYNIWTGLAVTPKAGDWDLLRDHVLENVCQGDKSNFNWLMTWMAQLIQQPGVKLGSAVVVKGRKGTGKSKVFDWLREAFGEHALKVSRKDEIVGGFNKHQQGIVLLVCEEAFWAGDPAAGNVLKDMITSKEMLLTPKGIDTQRFENYMRLAMISNERWVVPAGLDDERRFFVLECGEKRMKDLEFFADIDAQMESGGLAAMVAELLAWDPEKHGLKWNSLRTPPETPWLAEQGRQGLTPVQLFLQHVVECLEAPLFGGETNFKVAGGTEVITLHATDVSSVRASDLMKAFMAWMKETGVSNRGQKANQMELSAELEKMWGVTKRRSNGVVYECPPVPEIEENMRAALKQEPELEDPE